MRLESLVNALRAEPASFWFLNLYLLVEYVRPQSVWPALDLLPWGMTSLLLTVAAFVWEGRRLRVPSPIGWLLAVYTTVLVLSSFFAVRPDAAYEGWQLFFTWVAVIVLISSIVTTERRLFIFTLAFLLYSFKMSQHGFRSWVGTGFSFRDWGVTGAPGWFHNSGEFGIQMCVFLPLCVEFIIGLREHWSRLTRWFFYLMPITAVGGMVASSSRGALVGGAAVGLWWMARSKHRVRAIVLTALVAVTTWSVVPAEQKGRFATAGEDSTSESRLVRWEAGIEMANDDPLLGIGYNNWGTYYGPLSHNIFIEAWSEMGYLGLFSFLGLIAATFVVNSKTRRLLRGVPTSTPFLKHMAYGLDGALIGFLVSGFFVTVLYYPYFWINLAMTAALHVATRRKRSRALRRLSRHGGPDQRSTSVAVVGS